MQRVISLLASTTEIVCALRCEDRLVGRSHECDFPPSVTHLPVCSQPNIKTEASGREIDRQVKTLLEQALSIYRVDPDKLRELKPDLILTQTQCEVCAVTPKDLEEALAQWVGSRPRIVATEPNSLLDVWTDIGRVAEALGVPEEGRRLVEKLKQRIAAIEKKAGRLQNKPTVASLEWIDPLMAAGNWMPELVLKAGGINLFGKAGKHSPWMSWEELRQKDPEVIVTLPCGWDIERTRKEMPVLMTKPEWLKLRAVRKGRVYLADGNQYFNRPGPRLVESLEILAEILHRDLFVFGHQNHGWQSL